MSDPAQELLNERKNKIECMLTVLFEIGVMANPNFSHFNCEEKLIVAQAQALMIMNKYEKQLMSMEV